MPHQTLLTAALAWQNMDVGMNQLTGNLSEVASMIWLSALRADNKYAHRL